MAHPSNSRSVPFFVRSHRLGRLYIQRKNAFGRSGIVSGMVKLEQIIQAHAGMVRRIASVYERHPDAVDDLAQDVWIAVWEALPRLNDPADLKPYIARITQNICVSHFSRADPPRTEIYPLSLPDPAPLPDLRT